MSGKRRILLINELPPALARVGMGTLPSSILSRGERAGRRFIEFFTANIRNRNTRLAYANPLVECGEGAKAVTADEASRMKHEGEPRPALAVAVIA